MKTITHNVNDPMGIHARPAGEFVKVAKAFESAITVKKGEKTADAKKIFGLMGMQVKHGEEVVIEIAGSDEEKAFEAVEAFLKENF